MAKIQLLLFDIDGTLTNGTTTFVGEAEGWGQTYSVRDGAAILLLQRQGVQTIPLSRNKTVVAKRRMEALGCETTWVGVTDKEKALHEIWAKTKRTKEDTCFVGDWIDDAAIFPLVGYGVALSDAHPRALESAHHVLTAGGGDHAIESLVLHLEAIGYLPAQDGALLT